MKKLTGLQWHQRNITELGCIKGGLDYLGREISFPWLYGGTGFAFVLNIQESLDPSGPTCWDTHPIFELAPNLGYTVSGITVEKAIAGETFPSKQRQAWDFVRDALDRGLPCYGWEVDPYIPDYSIIYGYEDGEGGGYLYSGWVTGGPRDWRTLGETDVQVLQVHSIELVEPASEMKVVQDALTTVVEHSATASGWFSHAGYATGPAGFDLWRMRSKRVALFLTGTATTRLPGWSAARWRLNFCMKRANVCQGFATWISPPLRGIMCRCANTFGRR